MCAFSFPPNHSLLYAVADILKMFENKLHLHGVCVCAEKKLQCLYNFRDKNRNVQGMLMDECYVKHQAAPHSYGNWSSGE